MYLLNHLSRVHIWQASPLLSCGDACQIWMWYFIVLKMREWFAYVFVVCIHVCASAFIHIYLHMHVCIYQELIGSWYVYVDVSYSHLRLYIITISSL